MGKGEECEDESKSSEFRLSVRMRTKVRVLLREGLSGQSGVENGAEARD